MTETTEILAFYDNPTNGLMCIGHDNSKVLEQVEMALWEKDLCDALSRALRGTDNKVKVAKIEYEGNDVTNINWQ